MCWSLWLNFNSFAGSFRFREVFFHYWPAKSLLCLWVADWERDSSFLDSNRWPFQKKVKKWTKICLLLNSPLIIPNCSNLAGLSKVVSFLGGSYQCIAATFKCLIISRAQPRFESGHTFRWKCNLKCSRCPLFLYHGGVVYSETRTLADLKKPGNLSAHL